MLAGRRGTADHGLSALEAMDTVDQELHEFGAAVLNLETCQLQDRRPAWERLAARRRVYRPAS